MYSVDSPVSGMAPKTDKLGDLKKSKLVSKEMAGLRKSMPNALDGAPALSAFLRAWAPDTPHDAGLKFCTATVSAFFDFDLLQAHPPTHLPTFPHPVHVKCTPAFSSFFWYLN